MSKHSASLRWSREPHAATAGQYSRDHQITFENGQQALASAAPDFSGNPQALNPETLLIAALASCHMLTFLALCAKRGHQVEHYEDDALGQLGKNQEGRMAIIDILLRPRVSFADGSAPDDTALAALHERAHQHCFIANSIRSPVRIERR